ncbi:DNA-binding TFAR19-related protein [Artomyces pyxidatus]|uniref:DNA-binding TFAR19-related protein n=1 Tax=Artomyces pyxidatus TaxID=48021 RepID=A0ACB8SSD3_9AGAM|nr:DNA-binding TFAR19-related protein [Artomyces pyxidatus]
MADPELAALRAARLNQLQQSPPGGGGGGEEDAAKRQNEEQMRLDLLATVLDSAARERLSRISLVSPSRSRQIESILLRMAQTGQLRGKVSESQLIDLLEQAEDADSKTSAKKGAIVFQRKELDDDDDFDI